MTLEEKLKEIECSHDGLYDWAYELFDALRRCIEQRNNWAFECVELDAGVSVDEKPECHCQHIKEDDAELLAILEGKEGK